MSFVKKRLYGYCFRLEELRLECERGKSALEVSESGYKTQIANLTQYYQVSCTSHLISDTQFFCQSSIHYIYIASIVLQWNKYGKSGVISLLGNAVICAAIFGSDHIIILYKFFRNSSFIIRKFFYCNYSACLLFTDMFHARKAETWWW